MDEVNHLGSKNMTLVQYARELCANTQRTSQLSAEKGRSHKKMLVGSKTSNRMKTALTRHALQQFGVTHLTLPDVGEDVLHSFSPPQEVEHTQVVAHTLTGEHLTQV